MHGPDELHRLSGPSSFNGRRITKNTWLIISPTSVSSFRCRMKLHNNTRFNSHKS